MHWTLVCLGIAVLQLHPDLTTTRSSLSRLTPFSTSKRLSRGRKPHK